MGAVGERCGSPSLVIAGVRVDLALRGTLPKVAPDDSNFPPSELLFLSGPRDVEID